MVGSSSRCGAEELRLNLSVGATVDVSLPTRESSRTSFRQRLLDASVANDSLLCVGLDPDFKRFPASLRHATDVTRAMVDFNTTVIEATHDLVSAYKPNLGFYLAHGVPGLKALEATRRAIPPSIPVILDAKIGDIDSTTAAYAAGVFGTWDFDAVTVNPYLGEDALAPFLNQAGRGVIVLCKTSNPGSGDLQDLITKTDSREKPMFLTVADRVADWSERWPASLGLVVGATFPDELAAVRGRCPDLPILLPGVGTQAGDLTASLQAGLDDRGGGLMVSSSRSIIYAGNQNSDDWREAIRSAARSLRDEINAARRSISNSQSGAD
jgi:orotidine-5'-phosphate decarboxylase